MKCIGSRLTESDTARTSNICHAEPDGRPLSLCLRPFATSSPSERAFSNSFAILLCSIPFAFINASDVHRTLNVRQLPLCTARCYPWSLAILVWHYNLLLMRYGALVFLALTEADYDLERTPDNSTTLLTCKLLH